MSRRLRAYARRAHMYAIEHKRDVGEIYLWNSFCHFVESARRSLSVHSTYLSPFHAIFRQSCSRLLDAESSLYFRRWPTIFGNYINSRLREISQKCDGVRIFLRTIARLNYYLISYGPPYIIFSGAFSEKKKTYAYIYIAKYEKERIKSLRYTHNVISEIKILVE